MKKLPLFAIILPWMASYGSERSFLVIFSARDNLVKVSWKSDAQKCQNQLTPPYFDQLSERSQPLCTNKWQRCQLFCSMSGTMNSSRVRFRGYFCATLVDVRPFLFIFCNILIIISLFSRNLLWHLAPPASQLISKLLAGLAINTFSGHPEVCFSLVSDFYVWRTSCYQKKNLFRVV